MISYTDVFGFRLLEDGDVAVGDIVVTGNCATPTYVVVHLFEGRAWIRNDYHHWDAIVDQKRLRRLQET